MRKMMTDALLKSTQAPAVGRIEITDLRCAGLVFRVTPGGARSWCYRFRDPRSGRSSRVGLGPYPVVSLAQARTQAETMRGEVAAGSNPIETKRRERVDAPQATFGALADRYLTE